MKLLLDTHIFLWLINNNSHLDEGLRVEDNRIEIRIISVRKATRQEIQQYEEGI